MLSSVMPLCCATSVNRNGGSAARATMKSAANNSAASANRAHAGFNFITVGECKLRRGNPVLTLRARAVVSLAVFSVLPVRVAAQKDAFRDALIGFHANLAGGYGDEGPLVSENLAKMASTLATWDETIRSVDRDLRPRLTTAATGERVRMHTTLAELYVERGRY